MRLIAALLFALQSAAFAGSGSSTIDPTQPAFGSGLTSAVIRNQFQAAINDINALIKNNSGAAAPTSPALGQMWLNTSVNPYLLLQYDGSMWVTVGSIDPVAHTFNVDGYPIGTSGPTIALNNGGFTQSGLGVFSAGLQSQANGDTHSVRLGGSALQSLAITSSGDIGIGFNAAGLTTTGTSVLALGDNACESNTTGSQIFCAGASTLQNNTTGSNLSAGGYGALLNNTTGSFSTAFGAGSLFGGDCNNNSFFGYDSGQGISGSGCGGDNTGIGRDVMGNGPVTGTNNFGGGEGALNNLTSGGSNDALGSGALAALTTASFNNAMGRGALANYNGNSSIAMGYQACVHATSGNNLVCLGTNTGATLTTGSHDILIGSSVDVATSSTTNTINIGDVFKATGTNVPATSQVAIPGNFSVAGLANFTGGVEINGATVTLPVPVAIGGTSSANVSDADQVLEGILNASACGKAQTPAWCSGSDMGAWINAAISYATGQGWSQPKIILDPTSTYNQSTQITKAPNIILDCQGSNLVWQSTSGVALATGSVGAAVSKIGGNYNCNLTTAGGYSAGHTNIAVYSGGDPAGVINGVDATDANDIFFNFRVSGFKTPFTHGNNSWSSNLMFPSFSGNFYGIYGTPVLQGTVTAFAIAANVVTMTVSNSFTVGDVINITGLTTGTYLNKVPLTIATRPGSQFTTSFTHANVSLVSDSGTAFDGYYNGGEPSTVYGGSISNNTDCGLDLNYTPDQWNVIATHLDYNTVAAACGASPNVDFTNAYIEQLQAPMVTHTGTSGTAVFRFRGGAQTLTGTGTDNGFVTLTSVNDIASVKDVLFSSNHAVSYIVYTGALTGNFVSVQDPMYEPGSTVGNSTPLTDGISFFSKYSGGILIPSNSAIPLRAETFAAVGEHIDAPSLGTGSYFCNQLGLQLSTIANPNAQWCYYHGTGAGADTDKASLGMFGRNGVITADGAGVVGFDNSNLSAGFLYLDSNKHVTNTAPNVNAGTVFGNATGSSAAPGFTANPVLGVNATTTGTVGLANGGGSGATTTVQPSAVTSAVTTTLPSATGELFAASACAVSSASSVDIGALCSPGAQVSVTGTTNITLLGSTAPVGARYNLTFAGALTLTNGASLNLPGSANFNTTANWSMECYVPVTQGTWYCEQGYNPAVSYSTGGSINISGRYTGAGVNVNGSTVPINGMYLPSANTVGFSSNTTIAGQIDSTQHWRIGGAGTPTVGANACGTATQGTVTAGANDQAGQFTVGTAAVTSCVISFASAYATAPRAVELTPANATAAATGTTGAYVSAIGTTSFTVTGAALDSASYYYHVY